MDHSPEERVLLVARLKAEVLGLFHDKKIVLAEYHRISGQLDQLNYQLARQLPEQSMKALLADVARLGLEVETAPFRVRLQEGRLEALLARRTTALAEGRTHLDVSDLFDGVDRIPLVPFDWSTVIAAFQRLETLLENPSCTFEEGAAACGAFFNLDRGIGLPAGFAPPAPALMNQLENLGLIDRQQREALVADINAATQARHEARARLNHDFFAGSVSRSDFYAAGDPAYQLLRDQVFSTGAEVSPDLNALLVQWPGLNRAGLMAQWLKMSAGNRDKDELVVACTGIDPKNQLKAWQRQVQSDLEREKEGYARFRRAIARRKPLYDLAYMLGCHRHLGESVENLWWPMLRRFACESVEPASNLAAAAPSVAAGPPPLDLAVAAAPALGPMQPPPLSIQTVPVAARATAPPLPAAAVTTAPPIPKAEPPRPSAWEAYLKPFLLENWAWLVGFSLIMMALLFFSMVPVFRQLAGPVPLLVFSLVCGLMADFIHRRQQEATLNAGRVFAALCLLSLPFNYAIGANLLSQAGAGPSLLTGLGMGLAYCLLTPFLARRMAGSLSANLTPVLLAANSLLYLPALAMVAGLVRQPYVLLQALPFLSLLATVVLGLCRLKADGPVRRRLAALLLCANAALGTGLLFLLFHVVPAPATLAVLLQLIALTTAYFQGERAPAAVLAGGISVLGHLVALGDPDILPVSLALGALLWIGQRRHVKAAWPSELIALHLLLFVPALLLPLCGFFEIPMNPGLIPIALAVALVLCLVGERHFADREVRLISWALPVLALSTPLVTGLNDIGSFLATVLLVLTGAYAYWRYLRWFRQYLWFLNNGLLLIMPLFCLELTEVATLPAVAIYLNAAAFAWMLFSLRPTDSLARQHRCTLLWFIALLSVGAHGYVVMHQGISLALLVSSALALIPLLLAAIWSRSAFPGYVALGFVWTMVALARVHYGYAGRTGLGMALSALASLAAAHLLAKYRLWQDGEGHDRFLNRNFIFYSQQFLVKPCQAAAWVLTAVSLFKALLYFETAGVNFRIALALGLDVFLLARAALHFRSRFLGLMTALPALALAVALAGAVPRPWRVHGILLVLAGLFALRGRLEKAGEEVARALGSPLGIVQLILSLLSLPAGLLAVLFIWRAPLVDVIAFSLLAMLFTHWFLVRRVHWFCNHLVILHAFMLFTNLYWGPDLGVIFEHVLFSGWLQTLAGWTLVVALPAWLWEMVRGEDRYLYVKTAGVWAGLLSLGYLLVVSVSFVDQLVTQSDPLEGFPQAMLAFGLLHLAFRREPHWLPVLCKGFSGLLVGVFLVEPTIFGLFVGLLIFAAAEAILLQAGRFPKLKMLPVPPEPGYRRLAIVLQPLMAMLILTHLSRYWFGAAETLPLDEFLLRRMLPLYGMVPLCLFAAQRLGHAYLAVCCFALFAYANAFLSLGFMPQWRSWELTPLHALSAACVVSILVFQVLGRFFPARETT